MFETYSIENELIKTDVMSKYSEMGDKFQNQKKKTHSKTKTNKLISI